jgi:hypothetical protein
LRKKGKLEISEYKDYTFKVLSFKEMTEGGILPVFIVADHLFCPNSLGGIRKETGYKEHTVINVLSSLKSLGLLKKEGEQYMLSGTQEKLLEFSKNSSQCKLRRVEKIRLYVKTMELAARSFPLKEIKLRTNLTRNQISLWLRGQKKLILRPETAELLMRQGFISEIELEIWKKIGVCETTKKG